MAIRDDFIQEATELIRCIEDDVSESLYERGEEYFESVCDKARDMLTRVESDGRVPVTVRMLESIRNMQGGVNKWLNRDE